jgi:hypothetical protein
MSRMFAVKSGFCNLQFACGLSMTRLCNAH